MLLLAACADEPTASVREPEPKPAPRVLGLYEITLTGIGGPDMQSSVAAVPAGPGQSLSPVTTGLSLEMMSATTASHGTRGQGGQRYITSLYRVRNTSGAAVSNLTMIPATTASTISGTPFTQLLLFNGTAASTTLAAQFAPSGAVAVTDEGALKTTGTDVLQVFEESEVAAIVPPPEVTGLFPYGFVVRNPATPDSRILPSAANPNEFSGAVTIAFRYPLQPTASADPYSVSFYMLAVEDTETRVTESIEEGQDSASVRQIRERAAALGATTVTVLAGSTAADPAVADYPGQRQICTVRTAGAAGAPTQLITKPAAYAVIRVYRTGESPDACGAYFRSGTAQPAAFNMPYTLTLRAMDIYGNVRSTPADTVQLVSLSGPTVTLPAPAALISGVRTFTVSYGDYGTSQLRAVGRRNRGKDSVAVVGITRTWTGNVSTDWTTGGNWVQNVAPGALDSVLIPAFRPSYPVLAGNLSIGGVHVQDGATVSLGSFDLTATASVFTGAAGGSITDGRLVLAGTGTGHTVQGTLPQIQVTGNYSLAGPVVSRARVEVAGGRLRTVGHRLQTISY
jgi:hypothetical protein